MNDNRYRVDWFTTSNKLDAYKRGKGAMLYSQITATDLAAKLDASYPHLQHFVVEVGV